MNLSRRSLLRSLFAAPAVIAADRLMPIKLWVPTIYGDAIHDDWEGLDAWVRGERVNIIPRGFGLSDNLYHLGEGIFHVSRPVRFPGSEQGIKGKGIIGQGPSTTCIKATQDMPYVVCVESPLYERIGNFGVKTYEGSENHHQRGTLHPSAVSPPETLRMLPMRTPTHPQSLRQYLPP